MALGATEAEERAMHSTTKDLHNAEQSGLPMILPPFTNTDEQWGVVGQNLLPGQQNSNHSSATHWLHDFKLLQSLSASIFCLENGSYNSSQCLQFL